LNYTRRQGKSVKRKIPVCFIVCRPNSLNLGTNPSDSKLM